MLLLLSGIIIYKEKYKKLKLDRFNKGLKV